MRLAFIYKSVTEVVNDISEYLAAQETEISCAAIKQKIDDILTHLAQLDRK